jgi:hypothetical protein
MSIEIRARPERDGIEEGTRLANFILGRPRASDAANRLAGECNDRDAGGRKDRKRDEGLEECRA